MAYDDEATYDTPAALVSPGLQKRLALRRQRAAADATKPPSQESGADAGRYSAARVESNARAAHARRPAAPGTHRYDCPEERADGRRLGG